MINLTPELRQAIEQAGGSPVEITDPQTDTAYVLVRAEVFRRMQEHLDEQQDRQEQDALLAMSRKNRLAGVQENPY